MNNAQRSELAFRTLLVFMQRSGTEKGDAVSDLLCDLMHLADEEGYDFDTEMARAREHYYAEIEEEEQL